MKLAYTVWKDGTHKLWSANDAHHAEQDAEWLCTLPIPPTAEVAAQSIGELSSATERRP